jgi:hypothetical protein
MSDSMTIGAVAATILSMGAEMAFRSAVGEAAKDAYRALKEKIAHWSAHDLQALEKEPHSKLRQGLLACAFTCEDRIVVGDMGGKVYDLILEDPA